MVGGILRGLHALPSRTPQGFDGPQYIAGHAHGAISRDNVLKHQLSKGDWRLELQHLDPGPLRGVLNEVFHEVLSGAAASR